MVFLAKNRKQIASLKMISQKEGIPFDYLEKILSKLEKADLINSRRGVRGGYSIVKPLSKIKASEIIQVLEGEISLVKCMTKIQKNYCPNKNRCMAKKFWQKIQDALYKSFNSLTLADLIK